jgi:hypothetical protein
MTTSLRVFLVVSHAISTSPNPVVSDPSEYAPSHDAEVLEKWSKVESQMFLAFYQLPHKSKV